MASIHRPTIFFLVIYQVYEACQQKLTGIAKKWITPKINDRYDNIRYLFLSWMSYFHVTNTVQENSKHVVCGMPIMSRVQSQIYVIKGYWSVSWVTEWQTMYHENWLCCYLQSQSQNQNLKAQLLLYWHKPYAFRSVHDPLGKVVKAVITKLHVRSSAYQSLHHSNWNSSHMHIKKCITGALSYGSFPIRHSIYTRHLKL